MDAHEKKINEEMDDLRHEVDDFKREKERVRAIVGRVGGMPTFNTKIFNIIFIALMVVSLVISLFSEGRLSLAMIELAVLALSVKLILLIHSQSRVNHFQLWILSALEWRLDEIIKEIRKE